VTEDKVKSAIVELRLLTQCRCKAVWTDRGLHEPTCLWEWREDVAILAAAANRPEGDSL
jgi:hypothetical protein